MPQSKISPAFLLTFLVIIAISQWIGIAERWHTDIFWFTATLHVLGGGWGAIFFAFLGERIRGFSPLRSMDGFARFIVTLGFVALLGVLWELFEFFLDRISVSITGIQMQPGLIDTMGDLAMDLAGAVVAFLFVFLCERAASRGIHS